MKILIVDDEPAYRQIYSDTLTEVGFDCLEAETAEEALRIINSCKPAMIISDVKMPGMSGLDFLKSVKQSYPEMPFLLVTAYADLKDAVSSLKLGAIDYLVKPVDLAELRSAVKDALGVKGPEQFSLPAEKLSGAIVENQAMRQIYSDSLKVAPCDVPVLITGESGTGKEVLAEFIHRNSKRNGSKFVAINCACLPANLLASELFGHEKGAFTGAEKSRKGRFREASGGTIFLDEIGDMPLELQPALLRVLQTGKVTPVGADKEIECDFRLVAATNCDLATEVAAGHFREDLYYRLNVISFSLPPLRDRKEDISAMASHFLSNSSFSPNAKRLSVATSRILLNHGWPGNVRELRNVMERAAILSTSDLILPEHLPPTMNVVTAEEEPTATKTLQQAEKEAIIAALKQTDGNRTKAAKLLGTSRRSLIYKIASYQVDL